MIDNLIWRKPTWLSVIATSLGIFCLVSLGIWQLQRAEEKKQILAEIEIHKSNTPLELTLPISNLDNFRFKKVTLQGNFLSARQFLLDNRVLDQQVGYNVLTPFILKDQNTVVLIDRGWIPIGQSREVLPRVDVDENKTTLIGNIYVPFGKPFQLGSIDHSDTSWPRLIQFLDFTELSNRLSLELLPFTVRLENNQLGAYKTKWPVIAFTPNRHLAYAVQWFALASTLFLIFIFIHITKKHNNR